MNARSVRGLVITPRRWGGGGAVEDIARSGCRGGLFQAPKSPAMACRLPIPSPNHHHDENIAMFSSTHYKGPGRDRTGRLGEARRKWLVGRAWKASMRPNKRWRALLGLERNRRRRGDVWFRPDRGMSGSWRVASTLGRLQVRAPGIDDGSKVVDKWAGGWPKP